MKIKKVLGLVFPLVIVFGVYSCQTSMPTSDLELSSEGVNQEYEKVKSIIPTPMKKYA